MVDGHACWCSTDRVVEGVSLEIQELQIVRSLIPSVLLVIDTRARQALEFFVDLESLVHAEMQVVAEGATIMASTFLANVCSRSDIFRC